MKYAILIPALDPTEVLVEYIEHLIAIKADCIIVVDDGSQSTTIFDKVRKNPEVIVLKHETNLGKGKALKTGFLYYLKHIIDRGYKGIITADSDGQHSCEDVEKIAKVMDESSNQLVLGSRDFSLNHVPPKSKMGNQLTSMIFQHILRIRMKDTQTGLRGIPNSLLQDCLNIKGNRFEYETAMLIEFGRDGRYCEVDIETIYHDDNSGTHFNPFTDSLKIYFIIFETFFRYIVSSLTAFLVDFGLFIILTKVLLTSFVYGVFWSVVIARIFSSIINFMINRNFVFQRKTKVVESMIKYYGLCACIGLLSATFVSGLNYLLKLDEVIIKVFVDSVLFFASYTIQNKWIFKKGKL